MLRGTASQQGQVGGAGSVQGEEEAGVQGRVSTLRAVVSSGNEVQLDHGILRRAPIMTSGLLIAP